MYLVYDRWPEIAKNAYNSKHKQIEFYNINHIVFAGMGGSGTIGDIFAAILSKTNIHVTIVKGYRLPKTVDAKTLLITTSVSGNTKETLTILESSMDIDCKKIAFSSGGEMEKICNKNNIEFRKIEKNHSPRASLVNFLYSIMLILKPLLPIKEEDIHASINQMIILRDCISSEKFNDENPAINLAQWISGVPLIYYPFGLQAAAVRFKNSLQENSKIHAISEDVIEACHNGIVAWENSSNIIPILIQGMDDNEKTKERWKIIKEYFNLNSIEYHEVYSVEGAILSKLINLIYFFDYTSIYKAVLSKIDPSPVKSIDFIKLRS
ncbi:MAG: SIS domain-containing protein [Nitrosopumilus sp.]|nr:SIS domain-containing protein [Nitrosopumilus sp.]